MSTAYCDLKTVFQKKLCDGDFSAAASDFVHNWNNRAGEKLDYKTINNLLSECHAPEDASDMSNLMAVLEETAKLRQDDPDILKFLKRERSWIVARCKNLHKSPVSEIDALNNSLAELNLAICQTTIKTSISPHKLRRVLRKLCESGSKSYSKLISSVRFKLQGLLEAQGKEYKEEFLSDWLTHMTQRAEHLKAQEEDSGTTEGLLEEFSHFEELALYFDVSDLKKKTNRFKKKLLREHRETRLREKLDGLLGPRGVRFLNSFILAMIFLMVALLYCQFRFSINEEQNHIFLYIDLGICCFFLADFFFRLILAGPWYFWSHALLEFFPAIPYAFFMPEEEHLRAVPGIRVLPLLMKFARSPRILRPLIRSLRLCSFLMGGLDRLMKELRPLFDYNIQIGWDSEGGLKPSTVKSKPLKLQNKYSYIIRVNYRELNPEEGYKFLMAYAFSLSVLARAFSIKAPPVSSTEKAKVQVITLGEIASSLRGLDPVQVEVDLGSGTTERIASSLKYFNIFPFKYLPFIKDFARASRCRDNGGAVCIAACAVSRLAEHAEVFIHVFADFRGIGTGPQILDRISDLIIKTARRYASRLLIIGSLFLVITGIVKVVGIGFLHPVASFFQEILGIPIIVLGIVSSGVLFLALYMKRIAGEALESWHNTAEAQFINLGSEEKNRYATENYSFLKQRVLSEEETIFKDKNESSENRLQKQFGIIEHLYRDWQDGAMLHNSDIKLSEQLLGNIAVQQLRGFCLHETPYQKRLREKRSLAYRTASLFQPQFYFRLMTDTLSVEIAKLIVEYNRFAILLSEVPNLSPEEKAEYTTWLNESENGRRKRGSLFWPTEFKTTFFTAQHFLSPNPSVLNTIKNEFGDRVAEKVKKDRSALIKELYGLWPLDLGEINIYKIYQKYCSSFRIFLLPFLLIPISIRFVFFCLYRTRTMLNEIRGKIPDQEICRNKPASFSVAKRKILRMRQAILEEATQLRALVDPAYLGVNTPGFSHDTENNIFKDDLPFLQKVSLGNYLYKKRRQANKDMLRFRMFLIENGWDGSSPEQAARILAGTTTKNPKESIRSCFMAYCVNWHNIKVNLHAKKLLTEFFGRLRRHKEPEENFFPRLRKKIFLGLKLLKKKHRVSKSLYQKVLDLIPEKELRSHFINDFLSADQSIIESACLFSKPDIEQETMRSKGRETLRNVALRPAFWSDQLVSVKALQSIAILDIMSYFRLIYELGEYEEMEKEKAYTEPPQTESNS